MEKEIDENSKNVIFETITHQKIQVKVVLPKWNLQTSKILCFFFFSEKTLHCDR